MGLLDLLISCNLFVNITLKYLVSHSSDCSIRPHTVVASGAYHSHHGFSHLHTLPQDSEMIRPFVFFHDLCPPFTSPQAAFRQTRLSSRITIDSTVSLAYTKLSNLYATMESDLTMNEIVPNLWLGDLISALDVETLRAKGVQSVLSVMRGRVTVHEVRQRPYSQHRKG